MIIFNQMDDGKSVLRGTIGNTPQGLSDVKYIRMSDLSDITNEIQNKISKNLVMTFIPRDDKHNYPALGYNYYENGQRIIGDEYFQALCSDSNKIIAIVEPKFIDTSDSANISIPETIADIKVENLQNVIINGKDITGKSFACDKMVELGQFDKTKGNHFIALHFDAKNNPDKTHIAVTVSPADGSKAQSLESGGDIVIQLHHPSQKILVATTYIDNSTLTFKNTVVNTYNVNVTFEGEI